MIWLLYLLYVLGAVLAYDSLMQHLDSHPKSNLDPFLITILWPLLAIGIAWVIFTEKENKS